MKEICFTSIIVGILMKIIRIDEKKLENINKTQNYGFPNILAFINQIQKMFDQPLVFSPRIIHIEDQITLSFMDINNEIKSSLILALTLTERKEEFKRKNIIFNFCILEKKEKFLNNRLQEIKNEIKIKNKNLIKSIPFPL